MCEKDVEKYKKKSDLGKRRVNQAGESDGARDHYHHCTQKPVTPVVVIVVAVVFTSNRSFYPTSAVPPVSFLIFHPR